jgi:hypothetical protein
MSSFHPELQAMVIQEIGISAAGPVVFTAAMKIVFSGEHFEQLDQLGEEFKQLKLADFPGENIQTLNEKIKHIMDPLGGTDILTLGNQLLLSQVGIYEQSTSEHIRHWALDMYKTVVACVNRCCFGDHGKILATVSPDNVITYETLAEASNKKYHELVGRTLCSSHQNSANSR